MPSRNVELVMSKLFDQLLRAAAQRKVGLARPGVPKKQMELPGLNLE